MNYKDMLIDFILKMTDEEADYIISVLSNKKITI